MKKITDLFDYALLMAKGRTCFYGKWEDSHNYFENLGYQCPQFTNTADYFMDLMSDADIFPLLHSAADKAISGTPQKETLDLTLEDGMMKKGIDFDSNTSQLDSIVEEQWLTSFWFQTKLLVIRGYRNNVRNELFLWSELSQ